MSSYIPNIVKVLQEMIKGPGALESLSTLAPMMDWSEKIKKEHQSPWGRTTQEQTVRNLLLTHLADEPLIALIDKSMFIAEHGGCEAVPYWCALELNKFNFVTQYIDSFLNHIKLENPHLIEKYFSMNALEDSNISAVINDCLKKHYVREGAQNMPSNLATQPQINQWYRATLELCQKIESIYENNKSAFYTGAEMTKKYFSSLYTNLINHWIMMSFLNSPKTIDSQLQLIKDTITKDKIMFNAQEVKLSQALKWTLLDKTTPDTPAVFRYVMEQLRPEHYQGLLTEIFKLTPLYRDKIIVQLYNNTYSSLLDMSSGIFYKDRSIVYTDKNNFYENIKKNFLIYENYHLQLCELKKACIQNELDLPKLIEEDQRVNKTKNFSALWANRILNDIVQDCPVNLLKVLELEPQLRFNILNKEYTLPECSYLYSSAIELIGQMRLEAQEPVLRSSAPKALIASQMQKQGNSFNSYGLCKHYNTRRLQYIEAGIDPKLLPTMDRVSEHFNDYKALQPQRKAELLELLNTPNVFNSLTGFFELKLNSLSPTIWEKGVLNYQIKKKKNNKSISPLKI